MSVDSILSGAQTGLQSAAVGLNIVFIAFTVKHRVGTATSTILLRSQAVIDSCTMLLNIVTLQYGSTIPQPSQTAPAFAWQLYCRLYFSRLPYWAFVSMSVYNMLALSAERCVCLHLPFWYRRRQRLLLRLLLAVIVVSPFVVEIPMCIISVDVLEVVGNFSDPQISCRLDPAMVEVFKGFAFSFVILFWIVPTLCSAGLYAAVARLLAQSAKLQSTASSNKISSGAKRLTLVTAATTAAFTLLFSMDSVTLIAFRINPSLILPEIFDKIDSFLISMNGVVNPIVYLVLLQDFRHFVTCRCGRLTAAAAAGANANEFTKTEN